MSDSDDEFPPFRTASSSTDPPPTGHATRGPNMEKAVADADEAAQVLEATRGFFKKEDSKLLVAKRIFKAKMARFDRTAEDVNTCAVLELEMYYKAKLELAEATLRHGTVELMVAQAETSAEKALGSGPSRTPRSPASASTPRDAFASVVEQCVASVFASGRESRWLCSPKPVYIRMASWVGR